MGFVRHLAKTCWLLAPKNWLERKGKAKGQIGDRVADENSECPAATEGGIFAKGNCCVEMCWGVRCDSSF